MKISSQIETIQKLQPAFKAIWRQAYLCVSMLPMAMGLSLGLIFGLSIASANELGQASNVAEVNLQDACRDHFNSARQSEAALETLKSQPLRMVRIGGELDVALYDRLALVRRQRISTASDQVRISQSALSACLARQLSIQQGRMPAAAPTPVRRHLPVVQSRGLPTVPVINSTASSGIRPTTHQVPIVPIAVCDPRTSPGGCQVRTGKVAQ